MKKKLTVFLMLILLALSSGSALAQTEKQIRAIRSEVAVINKNLKRYDKKTKDVADISLEGTEAVFYSSGRGVKKITATMYGESYKATGEFYYQGEELIFAFITHNRYVMPIPADKPLRIARTEEQRYYYSGGNLIRLLVGRKEIKSGDERYDELKDIAAGISEMLLSAF